MAENIVQALIDEEYITGTPAKFKERAIEIVSDILGLDIEDITITDWGIESDEERSKRITKELNV